MLPAAPTTIWSTARSSAASRPSHFRPNIGNSGIVTFMVNHNGTVFQKDLGPNTQELAPKIEFIRTLSDLGKG